MLSFKTFLQEGLAPATLNKAAFIITKYLKKTTGQALFQYPGVEEFVGAGKDKGFGIRFMVPKKNYSFRLNWKQSAGVGLANLTSITFWNGHEDRPYVVNFENGVSVVKVLPIVADMLKTGKVGKSVITLPDDVPLNESAVNESLFLAEADFGMAEIFDGVLNLVSSPNFKKGAVYSLYKSAGFKVFDELERRYPALITKEGTSYVWNGKDTDIVAIKKQRDDILRAIGAEIGTVSRGAAEETYKYNPAVAAIENDMERLTFEEQLKDLENLTKLTIAGASNALFVAGKGGVGKTHTTEKILHDMGMVDGKNYFKNTGSASAAGIYSLLYKYQNDVILFDDSDSAFKDQESRNVFKAATDTKKIRKLVWNKKGANVMDPENYSKNEILDAGGVPQYFEFTGKIIVISNLTLDQLDPDGALRTRGYIINIDPTEMEIYDFMDKIVGKMPLEDGLTLDEKSRKHVVALLRKGGSKQAPNLRKLNRGINMAAGALAAGVSVSDADLARMIQSYS
jgi:hypothetical protein